MANQNILPVYEKLYGEKFSYYEFDQRMKMQKAVYLLQEMGVPVGDYGFRWYLHGPYSQDLQDDMHYENNRPRAQVEFFSEYEELIDHLHDVIVSPAKDTYSTKNWMECISSMHYLRENVLPFGATMADVLDALEEKKPHLSDRDVNVAAYRLMEGLFAV